MRSFICIKVCATIASCLWSHPFLGLFMPKETSSQEFWKGACNILSGFFSWHLYDREFWILLVFVCTLSPPRLSRHFHRDDRLLSWLCKVHCIPENAHSKYRTQPALSQHSSGSAPSLPGPCSVLPRKPASHFILSMLPRTHLQCPDYRIHSFIYLFYIWKDLVVESPTALAESVVDKQNVLYCPLTIVAHTQGQFNS